MKENTDLQLLFPHTVLYHSASPVRSLCGVVVDTEHSAHETSLVP